MKAYGSIDPVLGRVVAVFLFQWPGLVVVVEMPVGCELPRDEQQLIGWGSGSVRMKTKLSTKVIIKDLINKSYKEKIGGKVVMVYHSFI